MTATFLPPFHKFHGDCIPPTWVSGQRPRHTVRAIVNPNTIVACVTRRLRFGKEWKKDELTSSDTNFPRCHRSCTFRCDCCSPDPRHPQRKLSLAMKERKINIKTSLGAYYFEGEGMEYRIVSPYHRFTTP
jgi:hypothetical protein